MKFIFAIRKAVSACALTAFLTATSMVALAAPERIVAELTVSGKGLNGEAPTVLVNGEASRSGRSVFSSSVVSTTEETTAVLSVGSTGRVQLARNSSVSLVFDNDSIDAEVAEGTLTVLGSSGTVRVRTNDGKTAVLNPGESMSADGGTAARQQNNKKDKAWIWFLVAGGAAAAVIIAVTASGGNDSVVSPVR